MLKENLNKMIMESMKAHDNVRTEAYRAIKTAFMNWQTSKENAGKTLTDTDELQILRKMVKERQESAVVYQNANREDLALNEMDEARVIEELLPQAASEEDITKAFLKVRDEEHIEPIKKNMGVFVKQIKAMLPNADGKMVAQFVQKQLV